MKLFVFILALSFASPNRSSDHPLPSWNVKFQMHDHHFELYSVEDADVGFVDLNQAPNDPLHLILETKLVGKSFYISRLSHSFTLSLSLSLSLSPLTRNLHSNVGQLFLLQLRALSLHGILRFNEEQTMCVNEREKERNIYREMDRKKD